MKGVNPDRERTKRWHELECSKAELLLMQSNGYATCGDTVKGLAFYFKAVQRFCQLRDKRRAIELMTGALEWYCQPTDDHVASIMDFFDLTKQLCLVYPADITSYANLLFTMDTICRRLFRFTLLNELYQEILTNFDQLLPKAYKAKLLYTQLLADADSGSPVKDVVARISSAITYFNKIYFGMTGPGQPTVLLTRDFSGAEFSHCYAVLYHLLAKLAVDQLGKWDQLTLQQQNELVALFTFKISVVDSQYYLHRTYVSLLHTTTPADSLSDRLVRAAISFRKNALIILIRAHSCAQHVDLTEKLFVYHFNKLVGMYIHYDRTSELEQLLAKENVLDFMQFSGFSTQLPIWHRSLQEMKRALQECDIGA
jgi:hypothetical protein